MRYICILLMLNISITAMERYPDEAQKKKSKDVVIDMHQVDSNPGRMSGDSDSLQSHLERGGFRGMQGRNLSETRQWDQIFAHPDLMLDFAKLFQSLHNSQKYEQEKGQKQQKLQLKVAAITFLGVLITAVPTYVQLFQGDDSCNCTGS